MGSLQSHDKLCKLYLLLKDVSKKEGEYSHEKNNNFRRFEHEKKEDSDTSLFLEF